MLTIALSKGRILREELAVFAKAGIDLSQVQKDDRRLLFKLPGNKLSIMLLKPFDVPIYVEKGVADLGVVGSDVVMELKRDVFSILDLGIGRCRLSASKLKDGRHVTGEKLKIGTKFPGIAGEFYAKKGLNVEIIKLYGSIELAPLTGIADYILDIVSSGETLKKNGLCEVEEVCAVTSYLIGNRASFKTKFSEVKNIIQKLEKAAG